MEPCCLKQVAEGELLPTVFQRGSRFRVAADDCGMTQISLRHLRKLDCPLETATQFFHPGLGQRTFISNWSAPISLFNRIGLVPKPVPTFGSDAPGSRPTKASRE